MKASALRPTLLPTSLTDQFADFCLSDNPRVGAGWVLVAIVPHEEYVPISKQSLQPPQGPGYAPSSYTWTKYKKITRFRFVMGQLKDETLAELKKNLEVQATLANNAVNESAANIKEHKKALEESKQSEKEATINYGRVVGERDDARQNLDKLLTENRSLAARIAEMEKQSELSTLPPHVAVRMMEGRKA